MFKCTSCGDELFSESRKYQYQGKLVCSDCFVKQRLIDHPQDNNHNLDPNGCKLHLMEWLETNKGTMLIHATDGTWEVIDAVRWLCLNAATIPLISDGLLNWPEHGKNLQNSPQFTERLNEKQENE